MKPIFLFLLTAVTVLSATENLLKNPSFESGEQGWTRYRSDSVSERRLSSNGINGTKCAFIRAAKGAKAGYNQKVSAASGTYLLKWNYRTGNEEKAAVIELSGRKDRQTVFHKALRLDASPVWKTGSFEFRLPVCDTLAISFLAASGEVWYDDLSLCRTTSGHGIIDLSGTWDFQPGDHPQEEKWKTIRVPALWEKEGYPALEGFAWYRRTIHIPAELNRTNLMLEIGGISKADEAYWDGKRIGRTGSFPPHWKGDTFGIRRYLIPQALVTPGRHTLTLRVHDGAMQQSGGIWRSPCRLRPATPEEYRKITFSTPVDGNLFSPGNPPVLHFAIADAGHMGLERGILHLTVRSYNRKTAATVQLPVRFQNGVAAVSAKLHPLPEGFYDLEAKLETPDSAVSTSRFTFGVLPDRFSRRPGAKPRFGIAAHLNRLDDRLLEQTLRLSARIGADGIRTGFLWKDLEKTQGKRDFRLFDRTVGAMRRHGLDLTMLLAIAPEWASSDPLGRQGIRHKAGRLPRLELWADYAQCMASRYGDFCRKFEIWNEPNLKSYWKPFPDSFEYFRLLEASSAAIRRGAPDAEILTAGLVPFQFVAEPEVAAEQFLDDLYAYSGDRRIFDHIAYHPYPLMRRNITNASLERQMTDMMNRLRRIQTKRNDRSSAFYLTEIGAPDLPRTIDERRQAEVLTVLLVYCAAQPDIRFTHFYNFQEDGDNPDYNEHNFGLVKSDLSPKPALFAFHQLARTLSGRVFRERREENGVVIYDFSAPGAPLLVVWSDQPQDWRLPDGLHTVRGVTGEAVEIRNGTIRVGTAPVYLQ